MRLGIPGNYVYIWFIGNRPVYVGRGTGSRAACHIPSRSRRSDVARFMDKAIRNGTKCHLLILEDDLSIERASSLEYRTIKTLLAIGENLLNKVWVRA